jgi:Transglutaminase-like superfamily
MTKIPTHHVPFSVTLFSLACLLSLFLISGGTLWLTVALGAVILASYVLRLRLPPTWLPSLLFGGIFLALAILSVPQDTARTTTTIIPSRTAFLVGEAAAILMVIQFYRPTPSDPVRPSLFALLGGVLVLVASCNTFEETLLRLLIPVLIVLLTLSLRTLRVRRVTQGLTGGLLALALGGALGAGWLGTKVIRENRESLTEWGNRFMNERPQPELFGMAQQPVLGSAFGARGSNARVLRLVGKPRSLHLRGASFDTYSDSRWSPALSSRSFDALDPRQLDLPIPRKQSPSRVQVTRLQSNNPVVFFPLETFVLEMDEGEQLEWARDSMGPVRIRAAQPYSYFYQELPAEAQGLLARPRLKDKRSKEHFLQLPQDIQIALLPLAQRITASARTPTEKVTAVTTYLLENHPYSLHFNPTTRPNLSELPLRRNSNEPMVDLMQAKRYDMILRFLLSEPKAGAHCEFFATGAALLLRCVGVPTRYVTGYFAHEDDGPERLLVRQRDAHAWCEAWVEGKGWVTVEATPPTGWPAADKSAVERWRELWEWLEDRWFGLLAWLADREPGQLAGLLLVPFVAIALGAFWKRRRLSKPMMVAASFLLPPANLAELARRFEAALARHSGALSAAKPWSEQLTTLPEAAQPSAKTFLRLYQQARFGGQSIAPRELEAALESMEEALKKQA